MEHLYMIKKMYFSMYIAREITCFCKILDLYFYHFYYVYLINEVYFLYYE